uniref:Uncharacterized protein n=1 Tax=Photorhabdus asymbiotica TaxID=291112 RepID=D8MC11_9GAMM|nr:hypothetical protein pPAA3_0022 [Photorhabdus asymbiotica]
MATSEQKNGDQPDDEHNQEPASELKPGVKRLAVHGVVSWY